MTTPAVYTAVKMSGLAGRAPAGAVGDGRTRAAARR